jgi:hypothetical protein
MTLDNSPEPNSQTQVPVQKADQEKPKTACCPNPKCRKPLDSVSNSNDVNNPVQDKHNQLYPYPQPAPKRHEAYRFFQPDPPITKPVYRKNSVFLAGSIEMGAAVQWQNEMATALEDLPVDVYSPRIGDWKPADGQDARNKALRDQIEWELSGMQHASVICFFFDHDTLSPVTLLELGLWAEKGKVVVCCNKKFWKSGNVSYVCEKNGVPIVETFAELVPLVRAKLHQEGMMLDRDGNLTEDPEREDESRVPDLSILKTALRHPPE